MEGVPRFLHYAARRAGRRRGRESRAAPVPSAPLRAGGMTGCVWWDGSGVGSFPLSGLRDWLRRDASFFSMSPKSEVDQWQASASRSISNVYPVEDQLRRSWLLPNHPPLKICHSDRRDGAVCRPGAEKSLFDFGFQDKINFWRVLADS